MPMLGLGVWQVPDGPECVNSVRWALELGYRHIDTAQAYGNEKSVGRALRESGVPREDIFITTKFHPGRRDPVAEAEKSLETAGRRPGRSLHRALAPGRTHRAWPGMERALERGYTRSIGVSNFSVGVLEEIIAAATRDAGRQPGAVQPLRVPPGAARRVPAPPRRAGGVQPTRRPDATSPTRPCAASQRIGRTPAQVLLRWCVHRDVPVIPKSTHRERIEENSQIFDFTLSDADMAGLDSLDETGRTDQAVERPWW